MRLPRSWDDSSAIPCTANRVRTRTDLRAARRSSAALARATRKRRSADGDGDRRPPARSSRGRPGARERCSSSHSSGTSPRRSASSMPSSPSSPASARESGLSLTGKKGQIRENDRVRPGRHPLRGRGPRRAVPSSQRGQGAVPARRGAGRDGDRELPRRAPARPREERYSAISRCSTSGRCLPSRASCSLFGSSRLVPQRNWSGCVMSDSSARVNERYRDSMRKLRSAMSRKTRDRALSAPTGLQSECWV